MTEQARRYRGDRARRPKAVGGLVALLSTVFVVQGIASSAAVADDDDRAVQHIAEEEGIPPDKLQVINAESAVLEITRAEREDFKVIADDGRTFAVSFRAGTDEVVDPDDDIAAEADARHRRHGKVNRGLGRQMQENRNARIPVAIWVKMDDAAAIGRRGDKASHDAVEARAKQARAGVAAQARGFGAAARTHEVDLAPIVLAELNAGQINGLARRPDVERIEEIPEVRGHIDDSTTTSRFTYAWKGKNRLTGYGTKVAVHEAGGVDDVNPWMPPVRYWSDTQGNPKNIQGHPTNVAGVIGSTNPWYRGGAFQVDEILSANFPSYGSPLSQFTASAMWAVRSGAAVVNMSWGTICSGGNTDFFSRWVDYTVHTYGVPIVSSAGNSTCPSGTPQYVGSPSLGWNTISVGSYFDNNNGLRADDVLSSFSSWVNPTDPVSGQTYEKPDVVAQGGQVDGAGCHGVRTLGIGSGANITCGTSFSSPETAALVAGIVGRQPNLRFSPETVKAVVMAGATQNLIDGVNYRACPSSPIPGDCRDGAGGIDALQAHDILRDGDWRDFGHVTPSSWPAGVAGDKNIPVDLTAGVPFRGVLAWNSSADCIRLGTASQDCVSDVLNADLDLHLLDPNGNLVAAASSIRNSVEVIDYTPPTSGTYTLRARNFSFQAGTSTYAGVAWNTDPRDTRHPLIGQVVVEDGVRTGVQTTRTGNSYWDSYAGTPGGCVAFMSSSTGKERLYRFNAPSSGSITARLFNIQPEPGYGQQDIDVAIVERPPGVHQNDMNQHMIGCGDSQATATVSAGNVWVVVDGFGGSIARYRLQVDFTPAGGASPPGQQPLPDRS